jgi:AcrR family transcriptional regulator
MMKADQVSLLHMHGLDSSQQGLRSDARRNRDLVVRAAVEVFGEYGAAATMDQVATRAGVGKGTIYRSFTTRELLIEAAAITQLEELREAGQAVVDADLEPGEALGSLVRVLFRMRRSSKLILGLFGGAVPERARRARRASREPLRTLVERARDAGVIRDDVVPNDLYFLLSASSAYLTELSTNAVADWDRAAYLLLCGIGMDPISARSYVGGQRARLRG